MTSLLRGSRVGARPDDRHAALLQAQQRSRLGPASILRTIPAPPDPWTALTPSTGFTSPTAPGAPTNGNVRFTNFQSSQFCVRPGRLAGGSKLRRQVHGVLCAGDQRRRLDAEHELARHRDPANSSYSVGQWLRPHVKGGFAAADVGSAAPGPPASNSARSPRLIDNGWRLDHAGRRLRITSSRPNGRWAWNISTPTSATRRTAGRVLPARARRKCIRPPSRARVCWGGSTTKPAGSNHHDPSS